MNLISNSAELAVRPVGLDHELAVAAEEARLDAEMLEGRIGEIAEHRLLRRVVHRALMVRAGPQLGFSRMAGGADRAADVSERRRLGGAGSDGERLRALTRAMRRPTPARRGRQARRSGDAIANGASLPADLRRACSLTRRRGLWRRRRRTVKGGRDPRSAVGRLIADARRPPGAPMRGRRTRPLAPPRRRGQSSNHRVIGPNGGQGKAPTCGFLFGLFDVCLFSVSESLPSG